MFTGIRLQCKTPWLPPTCKRLALSRETIIRNPPPGWETSSFISGWAVKWANEVLPIATEAYNKLTFHANSPGWSAQTSNLAAYEQWAAAQVRTEIARAGYRLAAILKKIWP